MSEPTRDNHVPTPNPRVPAGDGPTFPEHPRSERVDWFRRMPNGGTVFVDPRPRADSVVPVDGRWFREMPNGGGTVYNRPTADADADSGQVAVDVYRHVRDVTSRLAVPPQRPTGGGTIYERGGKNGDAGNPSKK